ncbi:MAG TPA: TonB-dependent receptor [Nitrospirota bacterium]|nr:TonB-dependent receptor [Nitrospirota bacterium]
MRSFNVTYDRNYHYAGVRGFGRPGDYNTHILFLLDGNRMNDNVYDCLLIGTDFVLDVDLIDRIEVIRGPGSALYGSNAFFGVVNIITKKGRDLKGAEVSGEAGSFDTYKSRLSYGEKFQNGTEAILSGSVYDSNGQERLYFKEFDSPATNNGITEHTDYDRYNSYFTKASYRDFTFEGASITRTKGISAASFGTDFNDPRNKTVDRRTYLDLKYERPVSGTSDIMTRVFYGYYDYRADLVYGGIVNKDFGYGAWWGSEVKVTTNALEKHKLIFGGEYKDNIHQNQYNYDEDPFLVYLDDKRRSQIWASYIQDEVTLSKNVIFNAGVRYDHYDTFGGTTNPRFAFIYSPVEKTIFKLLYGTAFRAPTDYELYYYLNGVQKPNPGLKPETITTYELVYEQYIGRHLRGAASVFHYTIEDLISLTQDPIDTLLVYQNIAKVETTGFELEQEGTWGNGFRERISYSLQKSKNMLTGETLSNSPEHQVKANVLFPLVNKSLTAGIEEHYTSKRKTLQGNYAGSFCITNVTVLSEKLLDRLEVSASVYNLFDRQYGNPGSAEHAQDIIGQDGRSYRFKLTYRF